MKVVQARLAQDPNLRVVMREFPILSEGSVFAARAALAARAQNQYEAFHWALMSGPRATEETVMETARALGLDLDQLRNDMERAEITAHIEESRSMAQALGINGTPAFIIGDEIAPGYLDEMQFSALIDASRN